MPEPFFSPTLDEHAVHIWRVNWESMRHKAARLKAVLSADEISRAERYHFEKHVARFLVARGLLRVMIGGYVGQPPNTVCFGYHDAGKPYLADPPLPLYFNLSHAGSWVMIAITRATSNVGVDIETLSHDINLNSIMRHYFSADEISAWRELPPTMQERAFFNAWTRKEAFLKALGVGVGFPVNAVQVSMSDDDAVFLSLPRDFSPADWHLQNLDLPAGYVGALAMDAPIKRLENFAWRSDFA